MQCHSLEEGVFKADRIKVGNGCTLGINAFAHYGVTMDDNAILAADSFLMKGETVESDSIWPGQSRQDDLTTGSRRTDIAPTRGRREIKGGLHLKTLMMRSGRGPGLLYLILSAPSARRGPGRTEPWRPKEKQSPPRWSDPCEKAARRHSGDDKPTPTRRPQAALLCRSH